MAEEVRATAMAEDVMAEEVAEEVRATAMAEDVMAMEMDGYRNTGLHPRTFQQGRRI